MTDLVPLNSTSCCLKDPRSGSEGQDSEVVASAPIGSEVTLYPYWLAAPLPQHIARNTFSILM